MAHMSDYLENKIIDWLFRAQSFTPPATMYLALFTANPTDSGGGTEVTGGSYARVSVTSALANWAGTQSAGSTTASTGTSGTTSLNGVATFVQATANWGTITGMAIFDASSAGNMLFWAPLNANQVVNSGNTFSFAAGATGLTVQIDN